MFWPAPAWRSLASPDLPSPGDLGDIGIFTPTADSHQSGPNWSESTASCANPLRNRPTAARFPRQFDPLAPRGVDASGPRPPAQTTDADTDSADAAVTRLAELKRLSGVQGQIQARRRRLSELRSRFLEVQRQLSGERQAWCSLLKELGLEETLKINGALEAWQRLAEARELSRTAKSTTEEHAHLDRQAQSFVDRMRKAGRRADRPFHDRSPHDVLAAWDAELKSLEVVQNEHRHTRREWKDRRKNADTHLRHIRRRKNRVATLFARGGASNRGEFIERAGWVSRRRECQELLELANQELADAAASEPELAIVEEDFEHFDPAANRERIESLHAELAEIDRDLQAAFGRSWEA